MPSAAVTRRELFLGAQDAITGWYAKSFVETAIEMAIQPKGAAPLALGAGWYPKHDLTGFTSNVVYEGDEIIDSNNKYYEIKEVQEWWQLDAFDHYQCGLTKLPMHYDAPATYGTGASVEDPRHRTKDWIDGHINAVNLKEDNGTTNASYITCWANPPYPIKKVFVGKLVDIIFSIDRGQSKQQVGHNKYAYAYNEKVPVEVFTIDKTGITGENLMWQGERELRRISEAFPLGSVRDFETMQPTTKSLGSTTLYSVKCVLNYTHDTT